MSRLRSAARAFVELLLLQRRVWRHAGHGVMYLLLLVLSAWLVMPFKQLDWRLANALDDRSARWPAGVEVVDLGWDMDPATLGDFRARLAAALAALAALPEPPAMVVVDVELSTLPLGLAELKAAVQAMHGRGIQLVAVAGPQTFGPGVGRDEGMGRSGAGPAVYAGKALFGHTRFDFNGNSFWYAPCLELPRLPPADCLPAVPQVAGERRSQPQASFSRPPADARPVLFQPGAPELLGRHAWQLQGVELAALPPNDRPARALAHAVVIVGNLEHDRVGDRAGPEVLAWAIGANLAPSPPYAPRLVALTGPGWALGMALLFSAVALALFVLMRRIRALALQLALVAAASLVATLALLALAVLGLLNGLHALYPQVSYVVIAVGIAIALAWHATRANLRDLAQYTDITAADTAAAPLYDVFISYSHSPSENGDWVERELAIPLAAATLHGQPLRVFFDKGSLRVGTSWYFELAAAIERSRCLVAVYSSDYFSKSFCNFELGKAVVRDIKDQRRSFRVLPFMRGRVPLPTAYDHLQFEDAGNPAQMVATVVAALEQLHPVPD